MEHPVRHDLQRHGAVDRGVRRDRLLRILGHDATQDREPERLEHVLHLRGLKPAALRPRGEHAGHDAPGPHGIDPGRGAAGALRPRQPLRALDRLRERAGG